jgi:hypothetical protein
MNNPSAQGSWDVQALGSLLKETPGVSFEDFGFTQFDIEMTFAGQDDILSMFSLGAHSSESQDAFSELMSVSGGDPDLESEKPGKRRSDVVKEWAKNADGRRDNDSERYAILVFNSRADREHFCQLLEFDPNERYFDGMRMIADIESGSAEDDDAT